MPSRRLARWLTGFGERHGTVVVEPAPDSVLLTGADGAIARIVVPFPPLRISGGDSYGGLLAHVARERVVGVILVRRGGYAVGVFGGARLLASKVGSSYVQGTTKAGGWSQQRYARRRANQARHAFAAAADSAVRVLIDSGHDVETVVRGGDRAAVHGVLADPRLEALRSRVADEPFLLVPDPRLRVLEATPDQFLGVRIELCP